MSLVICLLYTVVALIETFGTICIFTRRLVLARVYAYLAFASALFVSVAGVVAAVTFFGFAEEVISECASLATRGQLHLRSTFQGEPWPIKRLPPKKAYKLCLIAWSHESSFQAASLFLCTLLPTALYLYIVYTYYRQITDPTHKACLLSSVPRTGGVRMEGVVIGPHTGAGANKNNSTGVTSARQNAGALGSSTQRRRMQGQSLPSQVQDSSMKEARGLLKQTKRSEGFATSQRRRLGATVVRPVQAADVPVAATSDEVRLLQATSLMKSASSPYKITPGPPSYSQAAEGGVRGYEAYGPRLDVYSASRESQN
ncbi:hypothetical protein AX14_007573 [Amanita brunnescens Koide BX004]|nr:hypothetical protein AX14_007573 [Amanita brunnescens Koide BX004]